MKRFFATSLVIVMAFLLVACSAPEKSIVGTWKSQSTVLGVVTETEYVFNEDGTGTKSSVLDIDFTYTIGEEKLTITTVTLGIESKDEYSFEFKDNKLALTNDSETISLSKVN